MNPRALSLLSLVLLGFYSLATPVLSQQKKPDAKTADKAKEAAKANLPPEIKAESAIVIDANTGRVLLQKNADAQRQVASTQKLMTALLICEGGNLDRLATVEDVDTQAEPTKLFLKAGEQYKRRDLLRAMLMKSANDSAKCLARNHAGSEAGFATLMNKRAATLGMTRTKFANASGLPASQYSTARDMARLARAAYQQPVIRSMVATKESEFLRADGRKIELRNTNPVLTDSPYCNGMKTGYVEAAGRCLVCSGKYKGREVIVVVLGSTAKAIGKESKQLLHWGLGLPQ